LLDARILVPGREAIRRTRQLKDQEGIFAGPSCGAALHAALRYAEKTGAGQDCGHSRRRRLEVLERRPVDARIRGTGR